MRRVSLAITLGLALLYCIWAVSESAAGEMSFLKIVTSPRAAGMGQCAINLDDEESGQYNPGTLGLLHLNKNIAFFYPVKSKYLAAISDDIEPRSYGFSFGEAFDINPETNGTKGIFSAALAYSRFKMELPPQYVIDEIGNIIGIEQFYYKSNNFTFSTGFDYWVRLGLGLTYKSAEEGDKGNSRPMDYTLKGKAFDFGIIAEIPFMKLISKQRKDTGHGLAFDITPSIAYVDANNGEHPKFNRYTSEYPLSHTSKIGFSLLGTVNKSGEQLASLRLSSEHENDLTETYGDVSKIGMEFGFWEVLFLRAGNVHFDHSYSFNTMGAGIDLGVLLSRFFIRRHIPQDGKWYCGALRNINLKIDFSRYNSNNDSPFDNTEFINIGFSL